MCCLRSENVSPSDSQSQVAENKRSLPLRVVTAITAAVLRYSGQTPGRFRFLGGAAGVQGDVNLTRYFAAAEKRIDQTGVLISRHLTALEVV